MKIGYGVNCLPSSGDGCTVPKTRSGELHIFTWLSPVVHTVRVAGFSVRSGSETLGKRYGKS